MEEEINPSHPTVPQFPHSFAQVTPQGWRGFGAPELSMGWDDLAQGPTPSLKSSFFSLNPNYPISLPGSRVSGVHRRCRGPGMRDTGDGRTPGHPLEKEKWDEPGSSNSLAGFAKRLIRPGAPLEWLGESLEWPIPPFPTRPCPDSAHAAAPIPPEETPKNRWLCS